MADFSALQEILDYRSLGAMYEEFGRRGIPNPLFGYYVGAPSVDATAEVTNVLDDTDGNFQAIPMMSSAGNGSVERFDTDSFEYLYLSRIKTAAPLNVRNAPARVMQPTSASFRRDTIASAFNTISLGNDSFRMLREPDNWVLQRKGRTEVTKQVQDFATQNSLMKQVYLSKVLFDGIVYLGSEGQILESSSGAKTTIDLGVPASNKTQINIGGNIIGAAWDVPGTDILKQLDTLKYAAEATNVAPPRHVWLNGANKWWIRNNTAIQGHFYGIERLDLALNDDTIEINNYVFHFWSGTYTDSSGSTQPFIPLTKALITPELGPWFLHAQGLQYVPTSVNLVGTVDEALNTLAEVYGDYSYVALNHNPVQLQLFMGSNFFYGYRNPNSIFAPTVDF